MLGHDPVRLVGHDLAIRPPFDVRPDDAETIHLVEHAHHPRHLASFGLFLQSFKDGKVVCDPGDKATIVDGKWASHVRSQFRINLNDIAAIYQEVREVDMRDPESY